MLITTVWIPVIVRRRRTRIMTGSSFAENLHRVAESGAEEPNPLEGPNRDEPTAAAPVIDEPESEVSGVEEKVRVMERDLLSGALALSDMTNRWIGLLREANDLHNSGALDTESFKELNTRLLEVPSQASRQKVGAASA
jgi:hypothetical protein